GTPSQRNGKLDLSHIRNACADIGRALRQKNSFHWVVLRSTVLPGTTEQVVIPAIEAASGKKAGRDFLVCFNPEFLREGTAFAGSCLPKDLRALTYRSKELDLKLPLLESILPSNSEHIERAAETILALGKRKIGVLGLSFKPGTDDLRESPMVHLVKKLIAEGCELQIWDENVALGQL